MNNKLFKDKINKHYKEIAIKSRTIAGYVNGKHCDDNLLIALDKDLTEIEYILDNYIDILSQKVTIGWENIDKMQFETL